MLAARWGTGTCATIALLEIGLGDLAHLSTPLLKPENRGIR
jgi:hypothetical protein